MPLIIPKKSFRLSGYHDIIIALVFFDMGVFGMWYVVRGTGGSIYLENLDGDTIDAPGRREDECGGSEQGRRSSTGILALGGWCSGCTARASCLFSSFGQHFLKRGGLVVVLFQAPSF